MQTNMVILSEARRKVQKVSGNVQRLGVEETRPIKLPRASDNFFREVDEIVHTQTKVWEKV